MTNYRRADAQLHGRRQRGCRIVRVDGRLGYAQPVGGVIAYEKRISISGVGFDIGCSNMALAWTRRMRTSRTAPVPSWTTCARDLLRVDRANAEPAEHDLLDDEDAWRQSNMGAYRQKATAQLGTVGSGNQFGRKRAKQLLSREQMDAWLRERGVLLAGDDLDESPMAYRRLPECWHSLPAPSATSTHSDRLRSR